jgi:hypothetical protein
MADWWIRCIDCNQVAHITDYDRFPQYHCDEDLDEITEEPVDDTKHFMGQHRNHRREELTVIKNSFISEGCYGEPLKVNYREATNGKERFVIKGWREDVKSPLRYELIPGYIKTGFRLEVQSDEIRRQMSEEMVPPPLAAAKIEQFIKIVEKVVSRSPMRNTIEITAESDTPLGAYCKMDATIVRGILRLSEEVFDAKELRKVEQFIYRNNNFKDPMTLLFKRSFDVKRKRTAPLKSDEKQLPSDGTVVRRLIR